MVLDPLLLLPKCSKSCLVEDGLYGTKPTQESNRSTCALVYYSVSSSTDSRHVIFEVFFVM